MKLCKKCNIIKPFSEYHKDKSRKDGYVYYCAQCNNDRLKILYDKNIVERRKNSVLKKHQYYSRNRDHIYNFLKSSKCIDCGDDRWQVLEFDHINDKKYGICDMMGRCMSISNIDKEISKCEVRCANCHRLKTAKQFGWFKAID